MLEAKKLQEEAEHIVEDVKTQAKLNLKKEKSTHKELKRALAREKDVREGLHNADACATFACKDSPAFFMCPPLSIGLEKALEKQRAAGAFSSPVSKADPSKPGSARRASRPHDFALEAKDLLEMQDHDAMCRVLNDRQEAEGKCDELREALDMMNQKVSFLEENGAIMAEELSGLKDIQHDVKKYKDQVADLQVEIEILTLTLTLSSLTLTLIGSAGRDRDPERGPRHFKGLAQTMDGKSTSGDPEERATD